MPSGKSGGDNPEPERSRRQQRPRPRTRRGRLLADLQSRLEEALAELKTHETTIADLAATFDKHRSTHTDLERRLSALEASHLTALDELRANRQRRQQHLTRLEHSVETQKRAVSELEQILDADEH
jgi:chromosome segregation ATPase